MALSRIALSVLLAFIAGCKGPEQSMAKHDLAFINRLPTLRAKAYREAQPGWDSGITSEMVAASEVLNEKLLSWAVALGRDRDAELLRQHCKEVYDKAFMRLTKEHGPASIVLPMAENALTIFLENRVAESVRKATAAQEFDYEAWHVRWQNAGSDT
jgi:hypothetical protein